jgi:hypothetical protein
MVTAQIGILEASRQLPTATNCPGVGITLTRGNAPYSAMVAR